MAFTLALLDWLPWLEPPAEDALTERQRASLVDAARSKSAYFRLLARDPDILEARTRTDKDIFYNTSHPACRAPNENLSAATSRLLSMDAFIARRCIARHAIYGIRNECDDVKRLLDAGVHADLGERWNAIVAASVALAATPIAFGAEHVTRLRGGGIG